MLLAEIVERVTGHGSDVEPVGSFARAVKGEIDGDGQADFALGFSNEIRVWSSNGLAAPPERALITPTDVQVMKLKSCV